MDRVDQLLEVLKQFRGGFFGKDADELGHEIARATFKELDLVRVAEQDYELLAKVCRAFYEKGRQRGNYEGRSE